MKGYPSELLRCNCKDLCCHEDPDKHHPRCKYVEFCRSQRDAAIERQHQKNAEYEERLAELEKKSRH